MPPPLLDEILALAGEPSAGDAVEIVGNDPIFPTQFAIGEAGAACIAASAVEAARVFQDRTGQSQRVRVEVDAAAAAMRSSRYAHLVDATVRPTGGGGLGMYRTADERWMYFHRLFPHHRERLFSLLGCADQEDAIVTTVHAWQGAALEDALFAAGGCGGMVRSAVEWQGHPQAEPLAELPLVEIERIGDTQLQPLAAAERPLSGVRVLDVTRVLAGPTCGRTLAEHGADVLRVGTLEMPDNEAMMRDTGHGKRSIALDLSTREGSRTLWDLIDGADVLAQGYRPHAMERLGFSVDEVVRRRPGIIYVSLSAFGRLGPWRDRRGFDSVVQTVSGLAADNGTEDRPRFLPANPLDYMTGYLAAFGVMVALRRRQTEGGSYHVRLSLAQTGRWLAGLPRVSSDAVAQRPPELPSERLDALMTTTDTPFGRLRHLKPAASMSLTSPHWDRPSVPLDHDAAEWLPRQDRGG